MACAYVMLCYGMLCFVMLCYLSYVKLCYVLLCMLCYVLFCYVMLRYVMHGCMYVCLSACLSVCIIHSQEHNPFFCSSISQHFIPTRVSPHLKGQQHHDLSLHPRPPRLPQSLPCALPRTRLSTSLGWCGYSS